MNIFDSHAHYDDPRFDSNRDALLQSLPQKNVRYVMQAACNMASTQAGLALAEKYPFIYASAGVHPHDAKDAPPDLAKRLFEFSQQPKIKAIGEIGLDYHYDFSPRSLQLAVFEQQLQCALELNLPVIVHDREAHADTLRLLQKYPVKGVVHCYSGSAEMAKELLKLGLYIGFTGVITFKNARKTAEAAQAVPLERLLIETDCPYMAPEPFRGKRCDSSMLAHTAQALADIKQIDMQQLLTQTCQNACTIFEIPQN